MSASKNRISRLIRSMLLLLLTGLLPQLSWAQTLEDVVSGAGNVGKFGIDVLQDMGLDGKTGTETGKDRLKDFVKGKSLDWLKGKTTGGDEPSVGMALILDKIYTAIGAKKRTKGGREGVCQTAALGMAWSTAFDAKNARVLRGAANTWFDLMTSTLPGAAGFSQKLLTEGTKTVAGLTAREIYDRARGKIEDDIKKAWAKQLPETFEYERTAGPCSIKMKVLWNKKKGKYLYTITSDCKCKTVSAGGGRSIAMKGFTVIGGGNIQPELDTRDRENPKMRFRVGTPRTTLVASCNCGSGKTWVEPPKEKKPVTLPDAPLIESEVLQPKCDACWPQLRVVQGYVQQFNDFGVKRNKLREEIQKEEYDTPDRQDKITRWKSLGEQQERIKILHDKAFDIFYACEQSACKNGTDPFRLSTFQSENKTETFCKQCQGAADKVNVEIDKLEQILTRMNPLARITQQSEVHHGTVKGNKIWADWHALKPSYDAQKQAIGAARTALSICKIEKCQTYSFKPFEKVRPRSGACKRCMDLQNQYNDQVALHNKAIDIFNAFLIEQEKYLKQHGDASTEAINGLEALKQKHGSRKALSDIGETGRKMDSLRIDLDICINKWCRGVGDESYIGIGGGGVPGEPITKPVPVIKIDAIMTAPQVPPPPRPITTRCKVCTPIVVAYNKAIADIKNLQKSIPGLVKEANQANVRFQRAAAVVNAFALPRKTYKGSGDEAVEVRNVDIPTIKGGDVDIAGSTEQFTSDGAFNRAQNDAVAARDAAQETLVAARKALQDALFRHDAARKSLTGHVINLVRCERRCASVSIRDVRIVTGNNPYDRRDPTAEDSTNLSGTSDTSTSTTTTPTRTTTTTTTTTTSGGGSTAPEPTIEVVNNIPISRLFLAAPDACPSNHYHGDANNCNGVFTVDPAPGVCGHGTVANVTSIPISMCPDL